MRARPNDWPQHSRVLTWSLLWGILTGALKIVCVCVIRRRFLFALALENLRARARLVLVHNQLVCRSSFTFTFTPPLPGKRILTSKIVGCNLAR